MTKRATLRKRGFRESLRLAADIAGGSLHLLKRYPILLMPLVPIFLGILALGFGLPYARSVLDMLAAFLGLGMLAFGLLFAFAVTSTMLRQIHEGGRPSLGAAIGSSGLWSMVPGSLSSRWSGTAWC